MAQPITIEAASEANGYGPSDAGTRTDMEDLGFNELKLMQMVSMK